MDRWDLVQSTSDGEDSSWIEDFADETLGDPEASGRFLDQVLSPSTKARRGFRDGLRKLLPRRESAIIEISQALGYLVSWPFGSPLRVGDIGLFESRTSFTRLTQVSEVGMDIPPTEVVAQPLADLNYTTDDTSVVTTDRGGRIEFARAGGTFFLATGLSDHRISDLNRFGQQLLTLAHAGKWQEGWNAVAETIEARQALFFVADEDGASVEILGAPLSGHVASADKMLKVADSHGMRLTYVANQSVVLFRTAKISKSGRLSLVRTFD